MSSIEDAASGLLLPHASELDAGQISRTFSKGLRVLETLASSEEPMSAQEIARAIEADRAVVYRMLRTLKLHGLLSETEGDGKYSLGLRFLTMARHLQFDVRRSVYPILTELADTCAATAFLGLLEGSDVVCFASVESRKTNVTVRYREGVRHPKTKGASGLAIQLLERERARDPRDLRAARELGYATSTETLESGTAAISVPVRHPIHGRHACVTLVYAKTDERDVPGTAARLMDAARRIDLFAIEGVVSS